MTAPRDARSDAQRLLDAWDELMAISLAKSWDELAKIDATGAAGTRGRRWWFPWAVSDTAGDSDNPMTGL